MIASGSTIKLMLGGTATIQTEAKQTACHFAKGRNPSKIQTHLELDFHQIPFQDVRTSDKRSPMCILYSFFKLQNKQNNPAAVESRLLRLQHNPSVGRSTAAALQL